MTQVFAGAGRTMFHKPLTALLLASWLLTACDGPTPPPPSPPPEPQPPPADSIADPTYEQMPTAGEMMELLRRNLRDPPDSWPELQALLEIEQELGTYRYVPSSGFNVPEVAEEPVTSSFAADGALVEQRLAQLFGGTVAVGCGLRPCIQYGDFNGDGRTDMAVQVFEKEEDRAGIVFLLTDGPYAVLSAGRASDIGDDLIWMMKWSVVPGNEAGSAARHLVLEGRTEQASVRLGAPQADGSLAAVASWIIPPSEDAE